MSCTLRHVPERLHKQGKSLLNEFEIGEEIYRRCKKEELENPFASISIADISVNRQGILSQKLSNPEDVLINILECGAPDYKAEICLLKIKDLSDDKTYDKTFEQVKNDQVYTARMTLIHDPACCMYPHCEFRVWIDGKHITRENHDETIGKLKQIRGRLKHALAEMIVKREISQTA